ncbi:MAG: hypothetical protein Q4D24_04560 [Erysipelotrichaceae bacterium]|nr:hypothetical protein [Erysipelotrichaceae bacterium]
MTLLNLSDLSLDNLLSVSSLENLQNVINVIQKVQLIISSVSESDDPETKRIIKTGTIIVLSIIQLAYRQKSLDELTDEDFEFIADNIHTFTSDMNQDAYSAFIFICYSEYIEICADSLSDYISEDQINRIKALSEEIRTLTDQYDNKEIKEVDYIEKCLWISLDAMIKLVVSSKTALLDDDLREFTEALSSLAFEYGRYALYRKEQALLGSYLDNQKILDDNLQKQYDDFKNELIAETEKFDLLISNAFAPDFRESLINSAEFARTVGVREEEILDSIAKIDDFFNT